MMMGESMILTWISVGAALSFLLTYRLLGGLSRKDKDEKVRAFAVENEALKRTNSIYRERIDQLEDTLFSNKKYHEMAREIEKLSAGNYSLRSKLKDLECLVDAERKRNTRERVEYLEKKVENLKKQLDVKFVDDRETVTQSAIIPVEIIPADSEVAVAFEASHFQRNEPNKKRKRKWSAIARARKL
ncbi:MAG: hypothetical protein WCY82_02815 [Desulfotomaculaceae bacterium]